MKKPKQLPVPKSEDMPAKQADNRQLQTFEPEEIRKIVLGMGMVKGDVDDALNRLANKIMPKYLFGSPKEKKEVEKEANDAMNTVFYGLETETQITLMEGFAERFRGGIKQICRQFIREFDCKTDTEKVLAETAAIAFGRYLDASRRLNNCLELNDAGGNKVVFMAMISKERDRAHRQFLSTVMTLKQFKSPTIEMNIKAKTAFVSQNQQINVPQAPHETNEAK